MRKANRSAQWQSSALACEQHKKSRHLCGWRLFSRLWPYVALVGIVCERAVVILGSGFRFENSIRYDGGVRHDWCFGRIGFGIQYDPFG